MEGAIVFIGFPQWDDATEEEKEELGLILLELYFRKAVKD